MDRIQHTERGDIMGTFTKKASFDVKELKKKPILPYEGMKFADEYLLPYELKNGNYHVRLAKICSHVSKCTPIASAFKMEHISESSYYRWRRHYREEKEKYDGTEYTTPIIMFFDAIYEAESNNEQELANVLLSSAIDERNTDSAKYLLDKRHKWKETKGVEVETPEDKSIEINISAMKDAFNEEEDEE